MQRDGQLLMNRKGELCVTAKLDLVAGTVQGHPDGFGFLVPDDGSADLFLRPSEMHKVLHGDRATARRSGTDRRGRPEGEIVDVLTRANRTVVGRLYEERGISFVVAENRRINQDLLVPEDDRGGAKSGDVVVVEIVQQPSPQREAIARVVEVLGGYTDPGMEIEIALRKHDLPYEFSRGGGASRRDKLPARGHRPRSRRATSTSRRCRSSRSTAKPRRISTTPCTAPESGKDFRLIVAIADVSHYVKDGDALDRDARERGTSVYFPRRVIPMLPEALSNELCSLKPQVDRLCLVCEMEITGDGVIAKHKFYPGVMHSRARLTYTQVWNWLSEPKSAPREAKAMLPHLTDLYALFHALKRAREARGAIDFDSVEMQLEFDVRGKIVRIVPVVRNDAHKLIEECMLAANVCTAEFLAQHKHPALYRVHEGPTPEKLSALRDFLASCALSLPGRRRSDSLRLRAIAAEDQGSSRLRVAADGAAALASAGAISAGQRRPLRAVVRGLRALHVADPPLSRPAGAPRDQGGAREARATSRRARRGPSSACTARSPSVAPTTRRATSRTGSSATSCRTRSARPSTARSAA